MKKKKEAKPQQAAKKGAAPDRKKYYGALAVILLITFIEYLPILKNGFVWDDSGYILGNSLIRDFSWAGLKAIFNNFSSDNYAPLTDVIRALQFQFSGFEPSAFHLGSIAFHLVNILLVFWFIRLLSENLQIATLTALLFAIHPLQVESVAWASSSSNLFAAAFFLGALISYLYFLRNSRKSYIILSLIFFALALLAKAVVVMLPLVLLLIDYYKSRKITPKVLLEKAPFFIVALAAGILTLILKNDAGAVQDIAVFSFPQRIVFACYSFITYLFKLLLPLQLSAFYPYPISSGADIPFQYYAYMLFFFGLLGYLFYAHRTSKKIMFSLGFFALTILLVLQLLPVGGAIMADRYTYLPSIAIFNLVAEGLNELWKKKQTAVAILMLSAFAVFFLAKTYARVGIWKSEMTLWNDVIAQHTNVSLAYNNRGAAYKEENNNKQALEDYNKAIELQPNYAEAYNNRGVILMNVKDSSGALNDYNKAIKLKADYGEAYNNRGLLFMYMRSYDKALIDYTKAIELKPDLTEAYVNRGNILRDSKRFEEARKDYDRAIAMSPGFHKAYVNRGTLSMAENKYAEAHKDLGKAIELKPDLAEAYFDRGIAFYNEKKYPEAIGDYSKAISLKADYADAYYNRGVANYYAGNKESACLDLQQAGKMGHPSVAAVFPQLCN